MQQQFGLLPPLITVEDGPEPSFETVHDAATRPVETVIDRSRSVSKILMAGERTKRTCADAAIADAENVRICSVAHLAVQHISPKRSPPTMRNE